jgi:hypothetical protein
MAILLFSIFLISKALEFKLGLNINDTYDILTNKDDVNVIGDDIRTVERSLDMLLNAC